MEVSKEKVPMKEEEEAPMKDGEDVLTEADPNIYIDIMEEIKEIDNEVEESVV